LETITDTDAVFNLIGFSETDIEAKRAETLRSHLTVTGVKNPFPRQPCHRVGAISYSKNGESFQLREFSTGG
jgi:hypothetical protein